MDRLIRAFSRDHDDVLFSFPLIPIFRSGRVDAYIKLFTASRGEGSTSASVIFCFEVAIRGLVSFPARDLYTFRA